MCLRRLYFCDWLRSNARDQLPVRRRLFIFPTYNDDACFEYLWPSFTYMNGHSAMDMPHKLAVLLLTVESKQRRPQVIIDHKMHGGNAFHFG